MSSPIPLALLSLFILCTSHIHTFFTPASASDPSPSLSLGSSLSPNQTIISADSLFRFGFFSLDSTTSSLYLGISYANLSPLTVVWVANRDRAVSPSAICKFNSSGLVTLTDNGELLWSIGEFGRNATSLLVQNTSNLVLQSSNGSTIWQSFDHPGNTWLPGMSLGPGEKLQCWLTPTNPRGGSYSLIMGNDSNFISVYNGTEQYWDSGAWNGNTFSKVPEMTEQFLYNFTFSNTTGFTYYVKPNLTASFNVSKFVMASTGLVTESSYDPGQHNWNDFWSRPVDPCQVIRLCGQNSICNGKNQPNCACPALGFRPVNQLEWNEQAFFHGCERKSPLNCSSTKGSNDGFFSVNQTSFVWSFTSSVAMADQQKCQDLCLANCSCNGFYFDDTGTGNCSLFSDPLYNGTVSTSLVSGAFYLRVAAVDLVSTEVTGGGSKGKTGVYVGVAVAAIASLGVISLVVCVVMRRKKIAAAQAPEPGLRAFTYAELQAATKNFKERLGGGGFGNVFRGVINVAGTEDFSSRSSGAASLVVAVKKLHRLEEGDKQFRAEVRTIGTIQHVNLVRLLGFCSEGKHRLLVYEMAPNGSLDHALFQNAHPATTSPSLPVLPWNVRFNIALGAARGIAYLHEACRECIIHCDIKPENLLLDASHTVKVADFGLAKLVGREFSHVLTTLRGTRGYLAPEWMAGLPITAKADVYSFGMTMLELVSGHRNIPSNDRVAIAAETDFFPVWAAQVIHRGGANLACLLDPRLEGNANMEELQRVIYCAIWCIQDNEDARLAMGKIVQMLEGTLPLPIPPIPTSLQCLVEPSSFDTKSSSYFSQD